MFFTYVILHGLFYASIGTGYLFLFMITFNPRVWGYQDYPEAIKKKVPPQTRQERLLAGIVSVPWFIFTLGFPLVSTYMLKLQLGGEISFEIAFLNIFVLFLFFTFGDLVILDWLLISKITPRFVIIPGTQVEDYKDFSHHYKAHAIATIPLLLLCVVFAAIVVLI
ncbi:MAG: hypothetical protein ACFE95_02865 [Candidatus Hodarchaeota archaeon]